jgi:hypothetical protein
VTTEIKDEFRDRSDFKIGDMLNCEVLVSGYVRITHGDFVDRVFHLCELMPVLNAAIQSHNYDDPPSFWGPSVLEAVIPVQLAENEVFGTKERKR